MTSAAPHLEAVIFDLFGVLIAFDNDIVPGRLAVHCADPDDALRRLDGLMARREIITGELTLHQVHRQLVDQHGLKLTYPQFEAAVRAMQPELEFFTELLVSCDLGLAKPDSEAFLRASHAAGAEPEHCLFVDDTRTNVEAAQALGFQTHWFRDVPGLHRILQGS
jgi:FMN phosphatase YigB (HAD superfamily)